MMPSFFNQIIFAFIISLLFLGCKKATYQGDLIPQHNKQLNLFGFIDTLGNYIIPPKFSQVYEFKKDTTYAQAKKGYSYYVGLINRKGEWVYPPIIERFSFGDATRDILLVTLYKPTGRVKALLKPNFEILELDKDIIPTPHYSNHVFYGNKNCQIAKNQANKFGIINTKGKWICSPKYDYIQNIGFGYNKLIYAELGDKFGYIDSIGKVVIPFEYDVSRREQPNYFPDTKDYNFVLKDGKYIYINKKGEVVSPYQFEDYDINSTQHILKYKGKWGIFVNKEWLIPAEYDAIISYRLDDKEQNLINAIGIYNDKVVLIDKHNKRKKRELFNYHYTGIFGNKKIYISNQEDGNGLDYTLHCKIDDSLHFFQSFPLITNTNTSDSISFKLQNNKVTYNIKGKFSDNFHQFKGVIFDDSTSFPLILNCLYKEKYEYYPKQFLTVNRPIFVSNNPIIKRYEKLIHQNIQQDIVNNKLFEERSNEDLKSYSNFELSTLKNKIEVDINYISDKTISYTVRYLQWRNAYEELKNYIFQNGRLISFKLDNYFKPTFDAEHLFLGYKTIYYQLEKDDDDYYHSNCVLQNFSTFHFSKNGLIVKNPYERYSNRRDCREGNLMTYELLKPFIKTSMYKYLSNQKLYWEWYVEEEY